MSPRTKRAAKFLLDVADILDEWARDSRKGGWSTHQVAGNMKLAAECRKEAAYLRGTHDAPTPH